MDGSESETKPAQGNVSRRKKQRLLRVQFGRSTSKNYGLAVEIAEGFPSHQLIGEGTDAVHFVEFRFPQDAQEAARLIEIVSGWKSAICMLDNEPKQPNEVLFPLLCYSERLQSPNPEAYCFGRDDEGLENDNDFGCREVDVAVYGPEGLKGFGCMTSTGEFLVDKKKLKEAVLSTIDTYSLCPCLDKKRLKSSIESFPNVIDPRKMPGWEYISELTSKGDRPVAVRRNGTWEGPPDTAVESEAAASAETAVQESALGYAAFIDVETTGLDTYADDVVELSIVLFTFDRNSFQIGEIVDSYCGLRQPGVPISPDAYAVHHISPFECRGKALDDERVQEILSRAEFLVAHNAGFDRYFVERLYPATSDARWFCSCRGIPWRELGYPSARLQDLLDEHDIRVSRAHRADDDAKAAVRLLACCARDGVPHFRRMIEHGPSRRRRTVPSSQASRPAVAKSSNWAHSGRSQTVHSSRRAAAEDPKLPVGCWVVLFIAIFFLTIFSCSACFD